LSEGFAASWWPAGLAVLGGLQLAFGDNRVAKVVGACLLVGGLALTVTHLRSGHYPSELVRTYGFPVVVIALGAFVIHRSVSKGGPSGSGPDEVSVFSFWAGHEQKLATQSFRGGRLTAVMGGFEIDLREADLEPGKEAVVDVFALMGGGVIRVPAGWTVHNRITPIIGGVNIKTAGSADSGKVLRIEGLALMGGVEVRT